MSSATITNHIHVYQGSVTANGVDGTQVSENGSYSSPVNVELVGTLAESKIVTLAVRTDEGYKTTGTVILSDVGDDNKANNYWSFCWMPTGTFKNSISTKDVITNKNKLFYAKAKATTAESARLDKSVSLEITASIREDV